MIDKSWQQIIQKGLDSLDREYWLFLQTDKHYFPDFENFLNPFKTLPKKDTKAILFGQDPYPRKQSAIGYAFIDGMVDEIFSQNGFSKAVNRATSLRNFLKMQLKAEKFLTDNVTQTAIKNLPKNVLIKSIIDLKNNFEHEGVLLLNRALIFTDKKRTKFHVKKFEPFIKSILHDLKDRQIDLILFGNEAQTINKLLPSLHSFNIINTPHPYNISFIENREAIEYFSKKKLVTRLCF